VCLSSSVCFHALYIFSVLSTMRHFTMWAFQGTIAWCGNRRCGGSGGGEWPWEQGQ
jgi:hypothetical protein